MIDRGKRRHRLSLVVAIVCGLAGPVTADEPLMINQVVVHPTKPNLLFAAGRPQGALKSTDGGKSWRPALRGLKNTSAFHLAIAERAPHTLYLATFGGGVYKSTDEAETWVAVNNGLGNTNIHALAVDPVDADRLVVVTSTGELFRSVDGGQHWIAANQGVPAVQGDISTALRFDHARPPRLYLGLERLYTWDTTGGWVSPGAGLNAEVITALAFDPADRILYAGTRNDGLFLSTDRGAHWKPAAPSSRKKWIHTIVLDHATPPSLYISVITQGLFKSGDQGATWQPLSKGLPPGEDILSVATDPRDARRLYTGMRSSGIFLSSDGGASWSAAAITQEPLSSILDSLMAEPSAVVNQSSTSPLPPVPASFEKCTKCHGWTDPYLTQKRTFWRVPPNVRDWQPTVARMSVGNGVTPEEQKEITRFLNDYSRR